MRCSICGIQIDLVEDAIEEGWIPSFYDELDNEHQPACGDCVRLFLYPGPDGEWEVKEQYRGKLTYLEGDSAKTNPDDMPIEIWVREEEPAKPN